MPRLSKLIEKAEDKAQSKFGSWYERHKPKLRLYIPVGIVAWYFYGMFINSLRLGIASTFGTDGEKPASIWVARGFIKSVPCLFSCYKLGVLVYNEFPVLSSERIPYAPIFRSPLAVIVRCRSFAANPCICGKSVVVYAKHNIRKVFSSRMLFLGC